MHEAAYQDADKFATKYLERNSPLVILDIGSQDVNGTMRPIFGVDPWSYRGIDLMVGANVDIVADNPYQWEIATDSFDVAVCSQTLEHSPQPWWLVREIARVVKPGGLVYLCAPNTIGFHAYPVDCWRVWPDGMRGLMADAGIEPIEAYTFDGQAVGCTTGIGRVCWPGHIYKRFTASVAGLLNFQ